MPDNAPANDSSHEGRSALGRCPRCGATVIETAERYACEKSLAEIGPCPFRLGKTVLAQPLNHRQVHLLLTTGRTELLHQFISKSGRTFSAYLTIDDTAKVVFEFPPSPAAIAPEPARQDPPDKPSPEKPCTVLLEAATQDLFRQNAFRITGLPVDASPREIAKHADRLKIMQELGQGASAHTAAFALSPPPTVDQIRDAIRKLKDPELRIIDEFFWFWPKQFDQARSDPALQAISNGSAEIAKQIWAAEENQPADGAVAAHNLAIAYHIAALDRAQLMLESTIITNRSILESLGDWRSALNRWERLLLDDRFWDHVAARIRGLDDDRLTSTRFDRRMRTTLPEALDKINATLALRYAERGIPDLARIHANLLREPSQVPRDVEKTIDLVLAPVKDRLREHLRQAARLSTDNPDTSDETANAFYLAASPILEILAIFYAQGNPSRDDLFDEVAAAFLTCAIAHQRKTHDNDTFVAYLKRALALASSTELKHRINENIAIGKSNLANARLEPVRNTLTEIAKGTDTIGAKFLRLRNEVLPRLESFKGDHDAKEALDEAFSALAWTLRSLSVDAHNDERNTEMALEIIELARQLAKAPDLQKRIADDVRQLTNIRAEQDKHTVSMDIKGGIMRDSIEITKGGVRYNSIVIPVNSIDGIRFGSLYVNGVLDSCLTGIRGSQGESIKFETKRTFRGSEGAQEDFNKIVNSLLYHIAPTLCSNLAKSIVSGNTLQLGECLVNAAGIRIPTGTLMWKHEHLVPWGDLRTVIQKGYLWVISAKDKKIAKAHSLRDVWNAVIFEEVTSLTVKLLAQH